MRNLLLFVSIVCAASASQCVTFTNLRSSPLYFKDSMDSSRVEVMVAPGQVRSFFVSTVTHEFSIGTSVGAGDIADEQGLTPQLGVSVEVYADPTSWGVLVCDNGIVPGAAQTTHVENPTQGMEFVIFALGFLCAAVAWRFILGRW